MCDIISVSKKWNVNGFIMLDANFKFPYSVHCQAMKLKLSLFKCKKPLCIQNLPLEQVIFCFTNFRLVTKSFSKRNLPVKWGHHLQK